MHTCRPLALLVVTSLLAPSLPAFATCDRDPVMPTIRADCRFGNQNIYFQVACMELYRYAAIADNVDAGARAALDDLKAKVDAAKAKPTGDQTEAFARSRGIAMASIYTANLHLSAAQLVLAQLLAAHKTALDKLNEVGHRNQEDAATLDYLAKDTGAPENASMQEFRKARAAEYSERVQGQAKAKTKLIEGIRKVQEAEKKLRTLRADLAKFKGASTSELAKLPGSSDKSTAASEDARTAKLSRDDQSLFDKIKTNCFQDNGLRLGCSRALEGLDLFTTLGALGAVKAMARKVGWQLLKNSAKTYFADDSMKQLLTCGQGKAFPVYDLYDDQDMGGTSTMPPIL